MNIKTLRNLLCVCVCTASFLPVSVSAQISTDQLDGRINTINTAVPFLRIDPDARSGAMGDVGISLSADANSIYWNTAKLSFADAPTALSVTYTPWLKELVNDIFLADVSGYKKLNDGDQIGRAHV